MMLDAHLPMTGEQKNELIQNIDAYWRAANYVAVGQIYLHDNPLLREPLKASHIKKNLLGHWGTSPGQNFIYAHLNRIIKQYDLDMIYISGPGHGGPAVVSNVYLEGTYTEVYPEITQNEEGLKRLFKQFAFPGGIPSHVSPECPGSMHEGGELGYSLSHAFGAAFDNPSLIVACVIGDGEAETGPLATSWHSNKFLHPINDGVVLPILHLNGYKISNPALLARIDEKELIQLMQGYGWKPHLIKGDDPKQMHTEMIELLDMVMSEINTLRKNAVKNPDAPRPCWPMIILKTPKGWTGPKEVDDKRVEGSFRSHQIPLSDPIKNPEHLKQLEAWLKSYKPEELFDEEGKLHKHLKQLAPVGERRMGANPQANGGRISHDLHLPEFRDYAVKIKHRGNEGPGDTRVLGKYIAAVMERNSESKNFRLFGPDEILSNRLNDVFEVTNRQWEATLKDDDEFLRREGRVMEMLSEHQCEGWLEGYTLTGRHGIFNSYEAFIHIIDSMFNQHAKWLNVVSELPWRKKIPSLNMLLSSHVWRQDHNGFTHQDPGFLDLVVNKKASVTRVYLPPDANCLLSTMDHCLRTRHYVNVIIAGKHPSPQWLDADEAILHCTKGIGIWDWASNDEGGEPDIVMACAGDVPTMETLAAVSILNEKLPELKIRVINIVDLMKLQPSSEHPHGLNDIDFDTLFTKDKPVVFAFHGYPWLIHRLTYKRANHNNIHVRGFIEEGTITTPFDMTVLNHLDRFTLVQDVLHRLPDLGNQVSYLKEEMKERLIEHHRFIREEGVDMDVVKNWKWRRT